MYNSKALEQIKRDEGESLTVYKCTAGVPTIGIGRNLERGISKEESNLLFMNDIKMTQDDLSRNFPWFYVISPVRQGVLLNMCFALGLTKFMGFKRMLAALKAKDYDEAALQILDSVWANRVGARAKRLSKQMKEG